MAKTYSCLLVGVDVHTIEIETVMGSGFSGLNILGLASDATRDMRERVRSALESIGIPIPARRVVVNVGPSDIVKLSRTALCQLDFAVAASVIRALFEDKEERKNLYTPEQEFLAGELSLRGELKPISNPLIYESLFALSCDKKISVCLPVMAEKENKSFEYFKNLKDWFDCRKNHSIQEKDPMKEIENIVASEIHLSEFIDSQIQNASQSIALLLKNPKILVALLVAAAGGHHILISGEPGIGKSFSLKKLPYFLYPLTEKERVDVKLINPSAEEFHRPFRTPHHSSTSAALVGGSSLKPGEVTLAHHGVLFLDELAEFPRQSIEALREPMDSGNVTLSRSKGSILYPAQFQLVATTNPCPCGYLFSRKKPCRCNPNESRKYLQKISGPILDRFCLQIWVDSYSDDCELDIFAQYLLNVSETGDLRDFVQHLFLVQNDRRKEKCVTLNKTDLDLKNSLSMRGQEKVFQVLQTFQTLFPSLVADPNFVDQVMRYRVLSEMFIKKSYF